LATITDLKLDKWHFLKQSVTYPDFSNNKR